MGYFQRCFKLVLALCLVPILFWKTRGHEFINVARGKPTTQTDTWEHNGNSSNAVDGDYRTNYDDASCTSTVSRTNLYWVVDLLRTYPVHFINITNRDKHSDRLKNFTIYVSDENPLPIPSQDSTLKGHVCLRQGPPVPSSGPHSFRCDRVVTGRYVYLWKPKFSFLTLCEFEVFVEKQTLKLDPVQETPNIFYIFAQRKSSMPPFSTSNLRAAGRSSIIPSFCIQMCLLTPGGHLTIVQMNHVTGECQCVEESPLSGSTVDVVDNEWTLMKTRGNL